MSAECAKWLDEIPLRAAAVTDTDQPRPGEKLHDILIADDDPDLRSLFARILARAGFEADTAEDGIAALAAAAQAPRRLVILDVNMPGATGLEVCRVLKAPPAALGSADGTQRDGRPRVLLVSADDSSADLATGYAAGADDYLTKPFHPRELIERVTALLG
jgi:DNA-binding response OmpR family regulator